MKVVYHLGWHKTGSTYLQEFFARNADKLLRDHSILYPLSGRKGTAHHLLFTQTDDPKHKQRTVSSEWPKLVEELAACADSTRNALISTESMQALSTDAVEALTGGAFMESAQVEAIAYLRRHDLFVESQYAERIKMGTHAPWSNTYDRLLNRAALYTRHLGRLRANRSLHRMILRPFEPARWKNQTLVDDFFEQAFGIELEGELQLPAERNLSPDPRVLHIVERFHQKWQGKRLPPRVFKIGVVTPLGRALVQAGLQPEKPVFLSPDERLELLRHYSQEIAELAEWTGGEVDFAADTVDPKRANRELFERPDSDQVRAIIEAYLEPDCIDAAWEEVYEIHRHNLDSVRRVFLEMLESSAAS